MHHFEPAALARVVAGSPPTNSGPRRVSIDPTPRRGVADEARDLVLPGSETVRSRQADGGGRDQAANVRFLPEFMGHDPSVSGERSPLATGRTSVRRASRPDPALPRP